MTNDSIVVNRSGRLEEIHSFGCKDKDVKDAPKGGSANKVAATVTTTTAMATNQVCIDDFHILRVLGKGAYGKVYQVRKLSGPDRNRVFAMKAVNKSRIIDSKTDVRHTRTERDVLASVEHPFVIKMLYAFETGKRLYFVQEFCRGGELFRLMETEKMFMEDQARFYLCEILSALEYLHGLNIVYRDLKTENIMLDLEGHIKLIDFGLSKVLDCDDALTNTFCGTVEYMAPEVVLKAPGHGKPADWWSFGIFMFDLLTGRSPFHSNQGKRETKERILRCKFTVPPFVSPDASDLLRRLIRKNVERRLGSRGGASEVKTHNFFLGIDWLMVEQRRYRPPHVPHVDSRDETDVSQFDPRFTSRTPRETESTPHAEGSSGAKSEGSYEGLFGDFEYVSAECLDAMSDDGKTFNDIVDAIEEEDNLVIELTCVPQLALCLHDLTIRSHGD